MLWKWDDPVSALLKLITLSVEIGIGVIRRPEPPNQETKTNVPLLSGGTWEPDPSLGGSTP